MRNLIILQEINQILIKTAKVKLLVSQSDRELEGVRRLRDGQITENINLPLRMP
jgi:hypothetical protein